MFYNKHYKDTSLLIHTFLAEDALVVEVATLADGSAVRGDADATVLARVMFLTGVRSIAPDTL